MSIEVNDANFKQEVVDSDLPVLVDFWAQWCMPCRMLAPVIDEISNETEGKLKVCKLNVDEARNTASEYGIMSIPTMILFKSGEVVEKITGALPKEQIMDKLSAHI